MPQGDLCIQITPPCFWPSPQGALVSALADDSIHLWNLRQKIPAILHSLKFNRERYSNVLSSLLLCLQWHCICHSVKCEQNVQTVLLTAGHMLLSIQLAALLPSGLEKYCISVLLWFCKKLAFPGQTGKVNSRGLLADDVTFLGIFSQLWKFSSHLSTNRQLFSFLKSNV